jgi:nucleotide-binding universal stress UspA family protein
MKLDKVLVPLDGSRLAEAAIPMAVDLVKNKPAATLVLLRAAEASRLSGVEPVKEQIRVVREAENYLASVAAGLVRRGAKQVKTSVWYGPAAPAIVEAAEFWGVDVIVMSTHGRSGIGRLILGSVAESVLRGTRTPILLVRQDGAPLGPLPGEAEAPLTKETADV